MKMNNFISYMKDKKAIIDEYLNRFLPMANEEPEMLHKAMRYSVFSGGKRLRPILIIFATQMFSPDFTSALPAACGVELIHTFSLIHDDLPALDNDTMRRGVPVCHKAFPEYVAILAGDALLTLGIRLISYEGIHWSVSYKKLVKLSNIITFNIGSRGLAGGEMMDLFSQGKKISYDELLFIHTHKTANLISASLEIGGILGGASPKEIEILKKYGTEIGIAFQIKDDILDVEGNPKILGKDIKSDIMAEKATYPAVLGMDKSKKELQERIEKAINYADYFKEDMWFLKNLALFIKNRSA